MEESTSFRMVVLGLRLKATSEIFPNRVLKLKCVAKIGLQEQEQNHWTFLLRQQKHNHGNKSMYLY